jgi:hypothetical protein
MRFTVYAVEYQTSDGPKTWQGAARDCFDALALTSLDHSVSPMDLDTPGVTVNRAEVR